MTFSFDVFLVNKKHKVAQAKDQELFCHLGLKVLPFPHSYKRLIEKEIKNIL